MQGSNISSAGRDKILAGWEALGNGNRQRAHQISVEILKAEPQNTEAWLLYARSANSKQEEFRYLTQAERAFPDNPKLKAVIYQELKKLLEQDPFLAYRGENEQAYQVFSREQAVLNVPKWRAQPEPFPAVRPPKIDSAYRLLIWAALGLFLSGLGALILAPAAGIEAWQELQRGSNRSDRKRASTVLMLSVVLFVIGLALAYLLWVHISG